ncbi:MAG: SMC-Scp complex subunit ScpB [Nitrospiraceae bacterium]
MTPITEELSQDAAERVMADTIAQEHVPGDTNSANAQGTSGMQGVPQETAERELKAILESMLFVSSEPLPMTRLVAVLGDVTRADVERVLRSLGDDLDQAGRGIRLVQVGGGYRLVTKQEYAPWIKRLDKSKSMVKLSRSALEALAIIAYKQPIVRSEIEQIRGVETSGVVRTLLERKLVRIVGRKEIPGRPIMYGTTKFFLEHFGLNDLSQLPPLREFKELGESERSMLLMDEAPPEIAGESVVDDMAKSMEVVDQDALPVNGEGAPVELKGEEELKVDEEFDGEPVEQR